MRNRVKALRAERGWSQAELADRLEVSRQTVNSIETAKSDPALALAMKLGRLFGVRVEDVFFPDGYEPAVWDTLDQHAGG